MASDDSGTTSFQRSGAGFFKSTRITRRFGAFQFVDGAVFRLALGDQGLLLPVYPHGSTWLGGYTSDRQHTGHLEQERHVFRRSVQNIRKRGALVA